MNIEESKKIVKQIAENYRWLGEENEKNRQALEMVLDELDKKEK